MQGGGAAISKDWFIMSTNSVWIEIGLHYSGDMDQGLYCAQL